MVRKRVRRGTVQLNLHVHRASKPDDYRINAEVLKGYIEQAKQVAAATGASDDIAIGQLLTLPGVIDDRRVPEQESQEDWPQIEPTLREALGRSPKCGKLRVGRLANDLLENCNVIDQQIAAIEQRAPNVSVGYRERLTERVNRASRNSTSRYSRPTSCGS